MRNAKTIVLPSSNPDLDGVACAVGYSEFLRRQGHNALPWICGEADAEARYHINLCRAVRYADAFFVDFP